MKRAVYPLDLSALAYPMMRTRKTQSNFRFEAELIEDVDPSVLQKSLEDTVRRYPLFKMRIAPSFFWHVLKESDLPRFVNEDDRPPLLPLLKKGTNGYPFRLVYRGKTVVLEVFHALTDGDIGALFMSDLLTRYAEIKDGAETSEIPDRALTIEDAFLQWGKKKKLSEISLGHYNGKSVFSIGKTGKYRSFPELLSEEIPLADLKAAAKANGATITEYIAASYILAILADEPLPLKKSVCLFVPVNLRRFFPSNTMQNFVTFERIYLKKGESDLSFAHVVSMVREEFAAKITAENMRRHVDDVRRCLTLPVAKYTPLFIKQPCFKLAKAMLNKVRQTAILSNIGTFPLGERAEKHVRNVKFFLNIGKNAPMNLAVVTCHGIVNVDVTNGIEGRKIPERFFALLKGQDKK